MKRRRSAAGPIRLREISLPEAPAYPGLAAVAAWRRAAGRSLASRSRAALGRDGWLEVTVSDDRWALALERMKASLLERMRGEPGARTVRGLRFIVDPSLRLPSRTPPAGTSDGAHADPDAAAGAVRPRAGDDGPDPTR